MGDRSFGRGWPGGIPARDLTTVKAKRSGTTLIVHREIAPLIQWLLDETEARGYLFDLGPKDPTDDWGYSNRPIGDTDEASEHSFATAVDLDATKYPQGQTRRRLPQWVIDLWAKYRFVNGVRWRNPDPMHMEFHGTVADARWLISSLAAHHEEQTRPPVPTSAPPVAAPPVVPLSNLKETPVTFIALIDSGPAAGGQVLIDTASRTVVELDGPAMGDRLMPACSYSAARVGISTKQLENFRAAFKA
jgi:hypothetical protein